jgi:hypothetical protein
MEKNMKEKGDLYIRFGPELKALIEQVAKSFGISQADYVRFVVRRDLERQGLLKGTASLEEPVPIKTQGR